MTPVTRCLCIAGLACTLSALAMAWADAPLWGVPLVWGGVLLGVGAINEKHGGK